MWSVYPATLVYVVIIEGRRNGAWKARRATIFSRNLFNMCMWRSGHVFVLCVGGCAVVVETCVCVWGQRVCGDGGGGQGLKQGDSVRAYVVCGVSCVEIWVMSHAS